MTGPVQMAIQMAGQLTAAYLVEEPGPRILAMAPVLAAVTGQGLTIQEALYAAATLADSLAPVKHAQLLDITTANEEQLRLALALLKEPQRIWSREYASPMIAAGAYAGLCAIGAARARARWGAEAPERLEGAAQSLMPRWAELWAEIQAALAGKSG